jgi:hypothetical protein
MGFVFANLVNEAIEQLDQSPVFTLRVCGTINVRDKTAQASAILAKSRFGIVSVNGPFLRRVASA